MGRKSRANLLFPARTTYRLTNFGNKIGVNFADYEKAKKGEPKMESFRTQKTCCRQIIFEVDDNEILTSVKFINGCSGNLQGIAKLAVGQKTDDLIEKLGGIICRERTSCPDQLAKALIDYKERKAHPDEKEKR